MDQKFAKLMLTFGVLVVGALRCEMSDLRADGTQAQVSSKYAIAEPEPWELERHGRDEKPQQDADSAIQKRVLGYSHDGYFGPSFGLRYDTGDGVAVRKSFLTPQVFIPLLEERDQYFLFSDLRGVFQEEDLIAANVGLGYRLYSDLLERTLGLYFYYDYRDAQENGFHQVSPGFEVLGETWDFRSNIYLPRVGDHRKTLPNQFAGNFLLIDRFQVAMTGADMELGVPLSSAHDVRLFGGTYHFQGPGVPDVCGWKVRCEAELTDSIRTNLSVQDDDLFGTTVNFWMSFRFPAGRSRHQRRCHQGIRDRFYEPVERLQNVVVQTDPGTPALDLTDGQPLFFLHVAAGGNSDGSFEDPYAMLDQALSDSRYTGDQTDVIYVRQNPAVRLDPLAGLQHEGDVVLTDNTQLLSNGPLQRIATLQGDRLLPFSGVDRFLERLPKINGQVLLADNTVLSGFDIETSDDSGTVSGNFISGININNNRIDNTLSSVGTAIQLFFVSGAVNIERNVINQYAGSGILLAFSNLTAGGILDNEIGPEQLTLNPTLDTRTASPPDNGTAPDIPLEPSVAGINVFLTNFTGDIRGNNVKKNPGAGLLLAGGNFDGTISSNTFNENALQGIASFACQFNGDIVDNEFNNSQLSEGIVFVTSEFTGIIERNQVNNNAYVGAAFYGTTFLDEVSISNNTFDSNQFEGLTIFFSSFTGIIAGNTVTNNGIMIDPATGMPFIDPSTGQALARDGVFIGAGDFAGDIVDNTITKNTSAGLDIGLVAFSGNITNNELSGNGTVDAFGSGLFIFGDSGDIFTGNITGNTIADNTGYGIALESVLFNGTISHNNVSGHMRGGMTLTNSSGPELGFNGDISDNHLFNNDGGIEVIYSDMTGNIASNTIVNNVSDGILVGGSRFSGRIERNIVNENGWNGLSVIFGTTFDGEISNNTFTSNGLEGMFVEIDGEAGEDFDVQVVNNSLMGNFYGFSTECIVRNKGSGTLNLTLSGNSSTNVLPASQFNFDLLNDGAGTFNVTPNNVDAANDPGTVGSSNGTVIIP